MKKKIFSFLVFIGMCHNLFAQAAVMDTIYPFKLIGSKKNVVKFVLSDNSNLPYSIQGKRKIQKFVIAIAKKQKVAITYNPATLIIKSAIIISLSKSQIFKHRHNILAFKKSRFNKHKSFTKNETEFLSEISLGLSLLKNEVPADSLVIIFNYFQSLSCAVTKTCTTDDPCISFDYKINGCNARAHLMRKILADKFGYDCQKIFLEGNLTALNEGGCKGACVKWDWHVAIYVNSSNSNGKKTGFVIDPSLFNRPCSIIEWVEAQEKTCCTTCNPGFAEKPFLRPSYFYTPNGSTDENYYNTYELLNEYCQICHPLK